MKRRYVLSIAVLWVAASLAGLWALDVKASRRRTPATPSDSVLPSGLVLFVHPHCPCSERSLETFLDIVNRTNTRSLANVIFVRPEETSDGWERGPLWDRAVAQGIRVSLDLDGARSKKFGAESSGHVVYIDGQGEVRFSGGVTRPGSHAGDNVGRRSLLAILKGQPYEKATTPVYGCPLY